MTSRFPRWIFSLPVLAALAVGIVAVPSPSVRAQQPAPVAQPASAPASNAAAPARKTESDNSEEAETTAFRHTALVGALARFFHLDIETTARLFEYINFAIIVLFIAIPLGRLMPKILRKRSQTIKHDIEAARKVTEDARTRLGAVEAKLSRFDEEIASLRAQIESEAKNDEARIKSTIGEESARIVASAEQEIGAAAAHAQRGLRIFATDLAVKQAARQLTLTPEADRALIAEFVSDAAKGAEN